MIMKSIKICLYIDICLCLILYTCADNGKQVAVKIEKQTRNLSSSLEGNLQGHGDIDLSIKHKSIV